MNVDEGLLFIVKLMEDGKVKWEKRNTAQRIGKSTVNRIYKLHSYSTCLLALVKVDHTNIIATTTNSNVNEHQIWKRFERWKERTEYEKKKRWTKAREKHLPSNKINTSYRVFKFLFFVFCLYPHWLGGKRFVGVDWSCLVCSVHTFFFLSCFNSTG